MTESTTTESTTTESTTSKSSAEHPAIDELREQLTGIELDVLTSYTLADAIREGAGVTAKLEGGYVTPTAACALGAGYLAARARGFI